jgi:anti-sigma factor RsiW
VTGADPFAHSDAAYAFGVLDADERAEFEAHLWTCPDCRLRVDQALSTVALLGPAGADGVDLATDDEAPPDTLLPGLLRRARRERNRRRAVTASIASVAAACLIALVVLRWPGTGAGSPSSPPAQALQAVQVSPVTATAALVSHSWGTEIRVRCRYAHGVEAGSQARAYGLRVIDRSGQAHDAGTWSLVGEASISFTGGTEVRRERIAKVQVTLADGTPVLQLTP